MKAQSFFGGTKPKDGASKVRQVGHIGKVQSKTGALPIRETVKQVRPASQNNSINRKTRVKQVGHKGSQA